MRARCSSATGERAACTRRCTSRSVPPASSVARPVSSGCFWSEATCTKRRPTSASTSRRAMDSSTPSPPRRSRAASSRRARRPPGSSSWVMVKVDSAASMPLRRPVPSRFSTCAPASGAGRRPAASTPACAVARWKGCRARSGLCARVRCAASRRLSAGADGSGAARAPRLTRPSRAGSQKEIRDTVENLVEKLRGNTRSRRTGRPARSPRRRRRDQAVTREYGGACEGGRIR